MRKEYWRKQNDEKLKEQNEREKREIDGCEYITEMGKKKLLLPQSLNVQLHLSLGSQVLIA